MKLNESINSGKLKLASTSSAQEESKDNNYQSEVMQLRNTMGTEATVFEIIGVLTMIAGDYHNQLRHGATEEEE